MERRLVLCGLLAGAVAGLLAFVFARIFAAPLIAKAIDYQTAYDTAQALLDKAAGRPLAPPGPDIFSRSIQANVGIGVGIVLFGAAMGGMFSVAFAASVGRVGRLQVRTLALLLALGGFLTIYLVPFLKYPANPPSIGHPETIKQRGALYLLTVVLSLLFAGAAVWLGHQLKRRYGNWNAALLAAASFAVVMGAVMLVLPRLGDLQGNKAVYGAFATETPQPLTNPDGQIVFPGFPADLLYAFRLYSVGAQLILWTTLGLLYAPLAERVLDPVAQAARLARRSERSVAGSVQATG